MQASELRHLLEQVLPHRAFAVRFWDDSVLPPTAQPKATLVLRSWLPERLAP
ncbi:MAG: SAM-dependent methyltransferase, partial [Armatimonadota bacterium]